MTKEQINAILDTTDLDFTVENGVNTVFHVEQLGSITCLPNGSIVLDCTDGTGILNPTEGELNARVDEIIADETENDDDEYDNYDEDECENMEHEETDPVVIAIDNAGVDCYVDEAAGVTTYTICDTEAKIVAANGVYIYSDDEGECILSSITEVKKKLAEVI